MKIDNITLTDNQVLRVVKDWYCLGMYPDILQNESGHDLEEVLEREIDGYPIRDDFELGISREDMAIQSEQLIKEFFKLNK